MPDLASADPAEANADLVFFHQARHHLENVENAVESALALLAPGGLISLDEYIGASRTQWDDTALALAFEVFAPSVVKLRQGPHSIPSRPRKRHRISRGAGQ